MSGFYRLPGYPDNLLKVTKRTRKHNPRRTGKGSKNMIGLYVNNNTPERFAFRIICGVKTVETRTKRAAKTFLNSGVQIGDRVAIIVGGHVYGYVTFQGVKEYRTRGEFRLDYYAHQVRPGSKYDYNDSTGKVGLIFSDPVARTQKDYDKPIKKTGGYTYAEV